MTKQIHIRLDDMVYSAAVSFAESSGKTLQDIVNDAVKLLIANRAQAQNRNNKEFTFIDLFAGIGGMRIAFERQGGNCVYSNEWNKYCQQTYFANFGEQPDDDITKVDARIIPSHDILVAGFPCQPFSIAGVSKNRVWDVKQVLKIKPKAHSF